MKNYQSNQNLLRRSLQANALFSFLSGAVLIAAATYLSDIMFVIPIQVLGFEIETVLIASGIGILVFACDVWLISRPTRLNLMQARLIIAMDILWVIASGAVLLLWPEVFTTTGFVSIAIVAVIVADLGLMEFFGVLATYQGQSKIATHYQGDNLTITATNETEVPAEKVWAVMRQQERYADVADNLRSVSIVEGQGIGLIRECSDTRGNHWKETCTRWQEGEGFAFRVHTDAQDYPYPIAELSGDWSVTDHGQVRQIKMTFQAKAKSGLLNKLAFRLIATPFAPVCDRLLRNWIGVMKNDQIDIRQHQVQKNRTALQS
jgi:hypothetical protein